MRAVHDVGHKLRAEGKRHLIAVDGTGLLAVDDEEIVPLALDYHIGVLADFDVAIGAEDEERAVAPGSQAVGSEPVEAHVAEAAVAAKDHVAEVLEAWTIGMAHVGNLRLYDLRLLGTRVVQELLHL